MPRTYSEAEIIEAAQRTHAMGLHTAIPVRVVTFYPGKGYADVAPVCAQPIVDIDGSTAYVTLPTFPKVPIAWPSGGGGLLTFPLQPGDPGLLVFSEVSLAEYLTQGAQAQAIEPSDARRHSAGYPIFWPGGARPDPQLLHDESGTDVVFGIDNDAAQVRATPGTLALGKGATDYVALASLVAAELGKIATAFHTFSPGSGGASFPHPYVSPGNVAATVAKAK
jgi:hypothetical protein